MAKARQEKDLVRLLKLVAEIAEKEKLIRCASCDKLIDNEKQALTQFCLDCATQEEE